jgi:hypothetical protein
MEDGGMRIEERRRRWKTEDGGLRIEDRRRGRQKRERRLRQAAKAG